MEKCSGSDLFLYCLYTSKSTKVEGLVFANSFAQWLLDHPEFLKNNLYVGGDSYSGIVLPMITEKIYYGEVFCKLV